MNVFCLATNSVKVIRVNHRNSSTMDVNHNACHLARSIYSYSTGTLVQCQSAHPLRSPQETENGGALQN